MNTAGLDIEIEKPTDQGRNMDGGGNRDQLGPRVVIIVARLAELGCNTGTIQQLLKSHAPWRCRNIVRHIRGPQREPRPVASIGWFHRQSANLLHSNFAFRIYLEMRAIYQNRIDVTDTLNNIEIMIQAYETYLKLADQTVETAVLSFARFKAVLDYVRAGDLVVRENDRSCRVCQHPYLAVQGEHTSGVCPSCETAEFLFCRKCGSAIEERRHLRGRRTPNPVYCGSCVPAPSTPALKST